MPVTIEDGFDEPAFMESVREAVQAELEQLDCPDWAVTIRPKRDDPRHIRGHEWNVEADVDTHRAAFDVERDLHRRESAEGVAQHLGQILQSEVRG